MEIEKQRSFEERNQRIIQAVLGKMEKICPGSVALIGIGGSFCSGDVYEKSDLDLFIVANDDKAQCLSSCFILDDVGFDIYCSSWDRLENMAEYNDPYVVKLIDLKIVYTLDEESENRYFSLQRKLMEKLSAPLCREDIEKAGGFLRQAESEYIEVMTNDELSQCRFSAALLLYYIEFSLYMLNKKYVRRGIKRIPEEISEMPMLPDGFLKYHSAVVRAEDIKALQSSCTELLRTMRKCVRGFMETPQPKKELTPRDIIGTYEEIHSNWRSKMYHSMDIDSPYLSFSTISSCQYFYNTMYRDFDIEKIDVIKSYLPSDLQSTAEGFDRAMEECLDLYKKLNVQVVNYPTIEDFERSYLT